MSSRRPIVLALAVWALVAGCGGDTGRETLGADAFAHLRVLASSPHRRAGTPELEAASRYVERALNEYGYDVRVEEFPFPYYRLGAFSVTVGGEPRHAFPVFYSGATGEDGATASCVGRDEKDVAEKHIVTDSTHLSEDRHRAEIDGAAGLLVSTRRAPIYTQDRVFAARFATQAWKLSPIPAMVVEDAEALIGREVTITHRAALERGVGRNVVAVRPGSSGKYLLVTAHLDSWFEGIVDDGTGVAVLLELARMLELWRFPVGLIFLVADCEELGLIGSSVFARGIDDTSIVAVLELDMVSAINGYSRQAAEDRASIAPFLVHTSNLAGPVQTFASLLPGRSLALPALLAHWTVGLRTDYEWFWGRGVPGLFVNTLYKEYHAEGETLDLVDPANLEAAALAARAFLEAAADGASAIGRSPHIDASLRLSNDGGLLRARLETTAALPQAHRSVTFQFFRDNGYEATVDPEERSPAVFEAHHAPLGVGSYSVRADVEGLLVGIAQAEIAFP